MRKPLVCLLGLVLAAAPAAAREAAPVPADREAALSRMVEDGLPTVFVFLRSDSNLERSFAEGLEREFGERVGLRLVPVETGREALVRQYEVKSTPTALVYDRRGRLVTRSSDAEEIRAAVRKAARVLRIDWAEDDDPRMAEIERLMGRRVQPGILRTMSLAPRYLKAISEAAQTAHFQDGYLDRRTKEMIATYVSALNKCKY